MPVMHTRPGGLLHRTLAGVLVGLATVTLMLFLLLYFLPLSKLNAATSLALFLVVAALLIAAYMLGFVATAIVAILFLTRLWQRKE